ncbi:uncharacterized protein FIBRA_03848 [Fibroporia radiculosa]|uniref:DUF4704 domain-containing protein n=1 Tax=Fibroporia radiculosa TaxID=599839 RepID=J4I9U7_9APHY|nr:uncharacterized protein FIBRA_03848 [Fibroporia radiculosa]CCM01781.1 predicted protein [Fibroporia radiculosa]
MFRTLLTPLSARFSFQPSTPHPSGQIERDELAPEVFARDVLVEVMRSSIERLKAAEILEVRGEVLTEIHKVMLEDVTTKDVFRETDGFLVVISVLSALQADLGNNEARRVQILDATRLAFVILAEALYQHGENIDFFKHSVGYDSLTQAILGLVSDRTTIRHTLGFLVSLALHRFSMSGIFDFGSETDYAQLDHRIRDFEPAFGTIFLPEALSMLYRFIPQASADGPALRYSIFKLLERLSYHNHRNHCVLSSLDIAGPLFQQYCVWKDDVDVVKQERQLVAKLLRRLIDVGTTTDEARLMFQRALRVDDTLDPDVLELLRAGMKVQWPEHMTLQSPAALQVIHPSIRGLSPSGFTFMIWVWIEKLPTTSHTIFSCLLRNTTIVTLLLRPDGTLAYSGSPGRDPVPLNVNVVRARWAHLTLVHYPHRSSNPTVRLFLDGVLVDALNWHYPGLEATPGLGMYQIGDNGASGMNWCFASAYLIASPLGDSIPRFIHHLGPRYSAQFKSTELAKFLTYEASTALHIHLDGGAQQSVTRKDVAQLHDAIKGGLKISESSFLFAITPSSKIYRRGMPKSQGIIADGDVFIARRGALDLAMWRIGGATVALRLVGLSHSAHEVSRALGILVDGLKNSWQNSEDMERLRGYDVLTAFLRAKSQYINMTGFETLFEFLGFNFRTPDQSTIVNTIAYRAIALDFQLWASTREEIQRVHLEHFATLLSASKFKRFNMKQRIIKLGVIRKLLFVLQTSLYSMDMLSSLIGAIKVVAQAQFTLDDAIKPIVSYLASNLHEVAADAASPRSIVSRIDYVNAQCKAEQVLGMLVSILSSPAAYAKFSGGLPVGRVCLLLLGERPSPTTASLILQLVGISLSTSVSFSRKFELASGWNVLKTILPHAWDSVVQKAAFDLLFGQVGDQAGAPPVVTCPQILPAIFSALKLNLDIAMKTVGGNLVDFSEQTATVESLLEELIQYHSTIPTFRHVFKSQAITLSFIEAYQSLVTSVSMAGDLYPDFIRILEKLSHLGLSIVLDNNVSNSQKGEIMEILQSAETALNPRSSQETTIDSAAVVGGKHRRRRVASVRLSVQLGESTVKRSVSRIQDWRKAVIATERKRIRKTVLDMREYHRQISSLTDWAGILDIERGLWANSSHIRSWRLDETEGPYRTR